MATEPLSAQEAVPATASSTDTQDGVSTGVAEKSNEGSQAPRSSAQTALLMFALCASVFLAALDITIISTALPTIAEHFHSTSAYTWVGSAYMLANAGGTPIWGKLSDIWGRKPLLLIATGTFFTGSVLCGASVNMNMLISGRAVQGLGGGGLLTLVYICVSDLFSMRNRSKYYGFIGMTWALASAVGPVLGGVLTDKASWRWCFYINLPITGCAFFIIAFVLHLHTPKTSVRAGLAAVDWFGGIAIIGATVMFLLGLTLGGVSHPWDSATVLCLLIFGPVLFVIFLFIEWKFARYPIMPISLFRNPSNMASLGACFFHGCILILSTYFMPLYFQSVLSATVLLSGVYLLPLALGASFTSGSTGAYISKSGNYLIPIRVGYILTVLGTGLLYNLPFGRTWAKIIIYQLIVGVGIGPNFQALLLALQNQVEPKDYATATATFGFTRNLATSIGIVIGNVVFQNSIQKKSAQLRAALGDDLAKMFDGKTAEASVFFIKNLPTEQREVVKEAFYEALRNVWILAVALAATGFIIAAAIKGKELSKVHEEIRTGLHVEEKKEGQQEV